MILKIAFRSFAIGYLLGVTASVCKVLA